MLAVMDSRLNSVCRFIGMSQKHLDLFASHNAVWHVENIPGMRKRRFGGSNCRDRKQHRCKHCNEERSFICDHLSSPLARGSLPIVVWIVVIEVKDWISALQVCGQLVMSVRRAAHASKSPLHVEIGRVACMECDGAVTQID